MPKPKRPRPHKPVVMISSTARDLPEHRKQVQEACHRADCEYVWMETWPASDADAVEVSMQLVDEADFYVGIFAHRYGYMPAGSKISVTEMEYDRAVKNGIPRLLFFIDKDHPIKIEMVETGDGAAKLKAFMDRVGVERVGAFFKSAEDLRGHVLHALQKAALAWRAEEDGETASYSLHYVNPIPPPPEAYIAHYYSLLQTRLIGRRDELELLTNWITRSDFRVLAVVAIGGMGKSALTWHWFNDIAPQEWPAMRGRLWWSFYESDGHFDNFVTRALAYVSRQTEAELRKLSLFERVQQLLAILDREPFLLVLDGLERILAAYARLDAPYLRDDDIDERAGNMILDAQGAPQGFYQTYVGKHPLRLAADPGVGKFLKQLPRLRASRILTSSRLYPADLQLPDGQPMPGCAACFLGGLSDADALELWRLYGAKGAREVMLPVFKEFGSHPLVLKAFAGEVANFRSAPGDFEAWRSANPSFNPYGGLVQVQSHILEHALRGLSEKERRTLHVIAGFRMPTGIDTLQALLVEGFAKKPEPDDDSDPKQQKDGDAKEETPVPRLDCPFKTLGELDAALTLLEDRGLLGWDRRANRYDLHPIVRGVVWETLGAGGKTAVCETLRSHFAAIPARKWEEVESLDDLAPAIELYNNLVSLGRFDDARVAFDGRLDAATLYKLSTASLRIELLERLFPDGVDQLPPLRTTNAQSWTLSALAKAYQFNGQIGRAADFFAWSADIYRGVNETRNIAVALRNGSDAQRLTGRLRNAEAAGREALVIDRRQMGEFAEAVGLLWLGLCLGLRGQSSAGEEALRRALALWEKQRHQQAQGVAHACLAQTYLWAGNAATAKTDADRASKLATVVDRHPGDFIQAARLQGTAALHLGNFATAEVRLHEALKRVRACDRVEEELPTLVALAELHWRQGEADKAREMLAEVWEPCERGPYPTFHADALNVLAQLERDAGKPREAVAAATRAYEKAWCDGPPFAYHWGLERARQHLRELGAAEPALPPFDESKYPPMPQVEIDPPPATDE